jgi:hypothetical protein
MRLSRACWSYPLATSDPDQASFNMVTAMLCRSHSVGNVITQVAIRSL